MATAPKINFFINTADFLPDEWDEGSFFKADVLPYPLPVGTHVTFGDGMTAIVSSIWYDYDKNEIDLDVSFKSEHENPQRFLEYFRNPENGWEN